MPRPADSFDISRALFGSIRITGTALTPCRSGSCWNTIVALTDATFTSLTGDLTNPSGMVLLAGMELRGCFTALQLTSGEVIAYYEPV
jgi:hypothetical protein